MAENTLNIKVHEYTLDNYPYYPTGHDVRTISISSSELEDCNQITTEEHANVNYTGTENKAYVKKQMQNEQAHKKSLNTKLCDPITGKLLVTKMNTPVEDIPYIDIKTDPKSYNNLNFSLDGIELSDILYFNAKFGAKHGIVHTPTIKNPNNITQIYIKKEQLGDLKSMNKLYDEEYIVKKLLEINTIFQEKWLDHSLPDFGGITKEKALTHSLIRMIRKPIDEQFVIFGDFHGGFPTLVRHMMRLKKLNIMDENCNICPGYNLIFLGDLVDRGRYGYETAMFVLLLFKLNPDRVFVNRGNHEEPDMNSAFNNAPLSIEMENKFGNQNTFNLLNETFSYMSSALIIQKPKKKETDESKYIYLAHGGYPVIAIYNPSKYDHEYSLHNKLNNLDNITNNIIIKNIEINQAWNASNSIRWSDFTTKEKTNAEGDRGYNIGKDIMTQARKNNIILTIRGHEDGIYNTKFIARDFDSGDYNKYDDINILNPNNLKIDGKYDKALKPQINCLNYSHLIKLDVSDNKNELTKFNINGVTKPEYIPILTISTNTDLGRDLFKDSFIILDFYENVIQNVCHLKNSYDEAFSRTALLYYEKIIPLINEIVIEPVIDESKRKILLKYLEKYYTIRGEYSEILKTGATLDELNDIIYNNPVNIDTFGANMYAQILRNKLYNIPFEMPQIIQTQFGPFFLPIIKKEGGNYYQKYLKYKAKYLKLKKLKN